MFLTEETLTYFSVSRMCCSTVWCCIFILCTLVELLMKCYWTVSDMDGTWMKTCIYHYRMSGPH